MWHLIHSAVLVRRFGSLLGFQCLLQMHFDVCETTAESSLSGQVDNEHVAHTQFRRRVAGNVGTLRVVEKAWRADAERETSVVDEEVKVALTDLGAGVDHLVDGDVDVGEARVVLLERSELIELDPREPDLARGGSVGRVLSEVEKVAHGDDQRARTEALAHEGKSEGVLGDENSLHELSADDLLEDLGLELRRGRFLTVALVVRPVFLLVLTGAIACRTATTTHHQCFVTTRHHLAARQRTFDTNSRSVG